MLKATRAPHLHDPSSPSPLPISSDAVFVNGGWKLTPWRRVKTDPWLVDCWGHTTPSTTKPAIKPTNPMINRMQAAWRSDTCAGRPLGGGHWVRPYRRDHMGGEGAVVPASGPFVLVSMLEGRGHAQTPRDPCPASLRRSSSP